MKKKNTMLRTVPWPRILSLAAAGFMLQAACSCALYAEGGPSAAEMKKNSNAVEVQKPLAAKSNPQRTAAVKEAAKPGAAPSGKTGKKTEKANDQDYILQKGDRIKITIYPEDAVIKGATMEISSEGTVTLPLAGKVDVAGKSAIDAQKVIAEILDKDYLVNPEVVIEVAEKYSAEKEKSVVLLGQIRSPGSHPFPKTGHFTLLQAIAVAGGFSDVANIKKIKIIRGGAENGKVIRANADEIISGNTPDIDLEDGDIINVAESIF